MEILLPAYFNNIVNRYKATIHLIVGRRLSFIVQRGFFIPPTYKVLLAIYYNGFMPVAYCFLISTAKVLPSVCLRRQLAHNIEPRNQQHLTLAISTTPFPRCSQLLTNLLSSCKRVLLERNLFFFELQIIFFQRTNVDPTHTNSLQESLWSIAYTHHPLRDKYRILSFPLNIILLHNLYTLFVVAKRMWFMTAFNHCQLYFFLNFSIYII